MTPKGEATHKNCKAGPSVAGKNVPVNKSQHEIQTKGSKKHASKPLNVDSPSGQQDVTEKTAKKKKRKRRRKQSSKPPEVNSLAGQQEGAEKTVKKRKRKRRIKNEKLLHTAPVVITTGPLAELSIKDQRELLPFFELKQQFLREFAENQVLIVIGETGSGKTTQMTQYLAETKCAAPFKKIGCTQPRRMAAISVAERVSEEFGCELGEEVGYTIRFDDRTSSKTIIEYMTDGILLKENAMDASLNDYSVIILDEAHERSNNIDILFGLLKTAIQTRNDLKVIVTSATLNAQKFSCYFFNAPIFTIPGQMFPVEVIYEKKPPRVKYSEFALQIVERIHSKEKLPGDILLFLTGQDEIDEARSKLKWRIKKLRPRVPEMIILPVYSVMPSEKQARVFEPTPSGKRKVIIATNIAETSLTIDGIHYVVDPGRVKQMVYHVKTNVHTLHPALISKAQAEQRTGRAGRTGPGKCYRLYSEEAFQKEMSLASKPEIQCSNLANTVLQLKAIGIEDVISFDFMDEPQEERLLNAFSQLHSLGAINDEGSITKLGLRMNDFPLEPMLAKMLINSVDFGCSEEILTIVSILSVENIFYRPMKKRDIADAKRAQFGRPEGDHVTLLRIYGLWCENDFPDLWCKENYLLASNLWKASLVRRQLMRIMQIRELDIISCGGNIDQVRKAICSACYRNAAKKVHKEGEEAGEKVPEDTAKAAGKTGKKSKKSDEKVEDTEYFTLVGNTTVKLRSTSSLYDDPPDWVVFHRVINSQMCECTKVEEKWLTDLLVSSIELAGPRKLLKVDRQPLLKPTQPAETLTEP